MRSQKYIKILLSLLTVIVAGEAKGQISYPWFVQTDVVKNSGATSDSLMYSLATKYRQTSRTFVDGLGREIQSIAVQASPLQNDIIQPVVYDNLGRQTVSYMAYAGKSTDTMGRYRSNALTAQAAFYNQTAQYLVAVDTAPHARQVFEKSPLQRLLSTGMVGTGYQPGDGGTQHYKTVSHRPNSYATDGYIYMVGATGAFSASSYYADNRLWVTDGIDEDGREAEIFKDAAGRTVLKRNTTGILSQKYYDTYYVYNAAGLISYIVPPEATSLIIAHNYSINTTQIANLIFSYKYNSLGLLYAKTVPNKGTTFIIYDPQNRPLLTRDSNMYAKHQWYYLKYDAKGRVISTGVYTDANHTTFSSMLSYVNSTYGTTYWYEIRSTASTYQYYTDNVFPTGTASGTSITPLTYNYYDNYEYRDDGAYDYSYKSQGLTGEETATTDSLKGLPTMSLKLTVGPGITTPEWLMTVIFYDKYGHVIQTQTNNQLYAAGTLTDNKTTVPDFTGKPLITYAKVVTGTASGTTNSVKTTFNYDSNNMRLASLDQVYNSQPSKRIASYVYNEAGQLILRKLDSLGGSWLQNVDYRYNIRGQITYINNSTLSSDTGKTNTDSNDLFGMEIMYDKPDTHIGTVTPSYSGMVSAVKWMTRDGSNNKTNERSYVYNYDKLGRDTSSWYAERPAGTTYPFNTNLHGFDEFGITYDAGGNILTLKRNSATAIGASSHSLVDNLYYTYDGTLPNQLDHVSDTTGNATLGFRNLAGSSSNYVYDKNGNLITDPYKGLNLKYSTLINRADSIMTTLGSLAGAYFTYTYDASGNVIRKQVWSGPSTLSSTTDYIGGFVYTTSSGSTTLTYIQNAEGRLMNTGGATVSLTPEYVITDQQGNARFSFEDNGTGILIRQENSYYAFGEQLAGSPVGRPTTPNINLYNGGSQWQSLTDQLPDYHQTFYRNYDPAIGRFIAVDPQPESAESLNVYQYAGDNPVIMNDPTGAKAYASDASGLRFGVQGASVSDFDLEDRVNNEADFEMWRFQEDNAEYADDSYTGIPMLDAENGGGNDNGNNNGNSSGNNDTGLTDSQWLFVMTSYNNGPIRTSYFLNQQTGVYQEMGTLAALAMAAEYLNKFDAWGENGFAPSLAAAIDAYNNSPNRTGHRVTFSGTKISIDYSYDPVLQGPTSQFSYYGTAKNPVSNEAGNYGAGSTIDVTVNPDAGLDILDHAAIYTQALGFLATHSGWVAAGEKAFETLSKGSDLLVITSNVAKGINAYKQGKYALAAYDGLKAAATTAFMFYAGPEYEAPKIIWNLATSIFDDSHDQ